MVASLRLRDTAAQLHERVVKGNGKAAQDSAILSLVWRLVAESTSEDDGKAGESRRQVSVSPYVAVAESYMRCLVSQPIDVQAVARAAGISPSQLTRLYKKEMAATPASRLKQIRVETAMQLLDATALSVKEISVMCGFANQNHFSRVFRTETGVTPLEHRRGKTAPQTSS